MNTLRLDFINKRAPYLVKENPHAVNSYVFKTDTGTEFVISLQENSSIVPSGAYEFGINNPHHDTPGSGESVTDTEYPDPLFYSLFTIFIKARPGSWDFGFLGILYFLILYKGI